ncbi:methyltransferase domain-containing protein [Alteromonadaceae bacterium M269]|nr:methyltransferase domain-containing protein [Alteromonadaceae bacterium M269]
MWICPACQSDLVKNSSSWSCTNGHQFDIAKEGYVNLLLANKKRTKDPGDNNVMINARRAFLEQGHYQPLASKVAELLTERANGSSATTLYDIGCGEGYYLNTIREQLGNQGITVTTCGSDISKNAIQKAAKKYKHTNFAVASNANLPTSAQNIDTVLQIFAPSNTDEVHRILKPTGSWCQVSPAPSHLKEIKAQIYDKPEEHKILDDLVRQFTLSHQEILTYEFEIADPQARKNLLMMTPFYWSADQNKIEKIIENLKKITASFHIRLFNPTNK